MQVISITSFEQWRTEARQLLGAEVPPTEVSLVDGSAAQGALDFGGASDRSEVSGGTPRYQVPRSFLSLARHVECHRHAARWNLLYQVLWRLTHGESQLLQITTDDDVHQLKGWQQQVRRDAHKMKAFVRFRRTEIDGREWYVAWYRPDHRIVGLVAPFFADRFSSNSRCFVEECEDPSLRVHHSNIVLVR